MNSTGKFTFETGSWPNLAVPNSARVSPTRHDVNLKPSPVILNLLVEFIASNACEDLLGHKYSD